MRNVAFVHTLKQLHYESKTKVKCQALHGLERSKIWRHSLASGEGILRYLTKESENHTALIKQLINTAIESAINKRKVRNDTLATLCQKSMVADLCHLAMSRSCIVDNATLRQGGPLSILGSKGQGHRTWITENDFRTTSTLPFHLSSWDLVHKLPISKQWPLLGLWPKVKVTRYR